jgi:hypothetical protein
VPSVKDVKMWQGRYPQFNLDTTRHSPRIRVATIIHSTMQSIAFSYSVVVKVHLFNGSAETIEVEASGLVTTEKDDYTLSVVECRKYLGDTGLSDEQVKDLRDSLCKIIDNVLDQCFDRLSQQKIYAKEK